MHLQPLEPWSRKNQSIINGTFVFTAEETEVWSVNTHQVHQSRTRSFISPPAPHYWALTWQPGFVEGEKGEEEEKKEEEGELCLNAVTEKIANMVS